MKAGKFIHNPPNATVTVVSPTSVQAGPLLEPPPHLPHPPPTFIWQVGSLLSLSLCHFPPVGGPHLASKILLSQQRCYKVCLPVSLPLDGELSRAEPRGRLIIILNYPSFYHHTST